MGTPKELKNDRQTVVIQVELDDQAKTDSNVTEFVIGEALTRKIYITTKVVTGDVGPGEGKTLTVNAYWSDEKVSEDDAPTALANRKVSTDAINLPAAAATVQYDKVSGQTALNVEAKYLYLSVSQDALAENATVTLTVWLVAAD